MNKLSKINDFWTVEALAEALGVAPSTLASHISRKRIPVRKVGRTPVLRLEDLGQLKAKIGNVLRLLEADNDA